MCRNRTIGPKPGKARQNLDQFPKLVHRPPPKILEPERVPRLAIRQKPVIPLGVAGREPANFRSHGIRILPCRKDRTIGPANLVERIDRAQIDIGIKIAPASCPKFAKHLRNSDDCRSPDRTDAHSW